MPTIPLEGAPESSVRKSLDGAWNGEDRRETEPDGFDFDEELEERPHPPEDLFAVGPTEHLVLPPRRDNMQIAVVAFVMMMLLSLLALFFRHRLRMEHENETDVSIPAAVQGQNAAR